MDILLGKVTQQAMNYAIRSGITITASYAIRQSSRLLKTVEGSEKEQLQDLQQRLDSKIRIISPAIDMIELISARGNTSLESAVSLTKSLRWEIQSLGQRLASAANADELFRRGSSKASSKAQHEIELKSIVQAIRKLLVRIEDAVPLINLAITASGASLSTSLPSTVSPSRLLQASTFLTAGDAQYSMSPARSVQIGPLFTLSMYMLFSGHLRPQDEEDVRQSTWKEVIHKGHVKLVRVPLDLLYDLPSTEKGASKDDTNENGPVGPLNPESENNGYIPSNLNAGVKSDEYAYQMIIIEDLDDDRVHTFEDDESQPGQFEGVANAGIREALPIHEISKIFYADTGKILNIGSSGETNNPVLLLKRDVNAIPPRRMMERFSDDPGESHQQDTKGHLDAAAAKDNDDVQSQVDAQFQRDHRSSSLVPIGLQPSEPMKLSDPWRIPLHLDPEWIAFEVYTESEESDTESETDHCQAQSRQSSRAQSMDPAMISSFAHLNISTPSTPVSSLPKSQKLIAQSPEPVTSNLPPIRTSLSLLETLLRLLSLQQFQQTTHLSIPDELLNFFLSESATTGAASGDSQDRRRVRAEARRRVGFDPYDESPVKLRGEDYQYRANGEGNQTGWEHGSQRFEESIEYDESPANTRYQSPRYNEEYETRWSYPQRHPYSREGTPQTPPMRLKNASSSSLRQTSERPSSSPLRANGRSSSERVVNGLWPGGRKNLGDEAGLRKGSPLARRGIELSDEGLGTSPVSRRTFNDK